MLMSDGIHAMQPLRKLIFKAFIIGLFLVSSDCQADVYADLGGSNNTNVLCVDCVLFTSTNSYSRPQSCTVHQRAVNNIEQRCSFIAQNLNRLNFRYDRTQNWWANKCLPYGGGSPCVFNAVKTLDRFYGRYMSGQYELSSCQNALWRAEQNLNECMAGRDRGYRL